jgi:hypothetical protein
MHGRRVARVMLRERRKKAGGDRVRASHGDPGGETR